MQIRNDSIQYNAIVVVDCNLLSEYKTENHVKLILNAGLFLMQICNIKLA